MRWWKSGWFHHDKGESEARCRAMSMRMAKRSLYNPELIFMHYNESANPFLKPSELTLHAAGEAQQTVS
jgi:hypothetical protein